MAEIQSSVIAADINDDGKIELVTTDTHGNVAAWTAQGKEIWEVHVKSLIPQVRVVAPFLYAFIIWYCSVTFFSFLTNFVACYH